MRHRLTRAALCIAAALSLGAPALLAQQSVLETRNPNQRQDPAYPAFYNMWTHHGSPLVDHLPIVPGIPTPKQFLGYYIGAPKTLTYYAKIVAYYRALAKATPRVQVEDIGRSDEGRELVVVWVSSEENMKHLAQNRANLGRIADPRGLSEAQVHTLIANTKPDYHLMGGLHSGETGPSEMLMELVYRLATETSPLITQIRDNIYVSVTPAAEPDGRDRVVDWFYHGMDMKAKWGPIDSAARADSLKADSLKGDTTAAAAPANPFFQRSVEGSVPYWGKYVFHDNNRDINLSQMEMRAITDWYFTAHPPIMHDLHEALSLMYIYSGGPPQNPNLDPILFTQLQFFANYQLEQTTKYGMPGVYTHEFMDAWSPGYLGSVVYNHNGMMEMYETMSGHDIPADSMADSIATAEPERRGGRGQGGAGAARGGRGGAAAGGRGGAARGGRGGAATGRGAGRAAASPPPSFGGGDGGIPTGKGGSQPREWFRGLPVPANGVATFTRRDNANYMETGVLSALQLTAMFPQMVLQNFYIMTRHSLDAGSAEAPYAYVIPKSADMTKPAELVNILRAQHIEVGVLGKAMVVDDDTFPAGSYVVKLNQPYGRLAKNLLEKQIFPDPRLTTYDDSGWSMGWAFDVTVKEIDDKAILAASVTPVDSAVVRGTVAGSGSAGLAVAHYGSNNMITFRYLLKDVPMKVADSAFTADGVQFPAGSFIVTGSSSDLAAAKRMVDSLGLTAASLAALPAVPAHDANVPRVAIFSRWSGTQNLGWYRFTFDKFHIPYDLIFKERVDQGNLKKDYDVIVMATQDVGRSAVFAKKAAHPQPYERSDKYKFLGMYGSTPDMSGGMGQAGVDAINAFLDAGGTLITADAGVSYPIQFGLARSFETVRPQGVTAQKPLVMARITRTDSPIFYGYATDTIPIKFNQGAQVFRYGVADSSRVLAEYVGGDASVLSGLMVGADNLEHQAFVADISRAHNGNGRVIMFTNNPIYRWQNHGEFNMVFNAIINWDDPTPARSEAPKSN